MGGPRHTAGAALVNPSGKSPPLLKAGMRAVPESWLV